MADVLQEAAQSFERLSKTNYEFTLSKKQKIIMSSLSASKGEFTHTFGLDHLDDIWQFASHNTKVKSQIFRDILKGNYTYQNLQNETIHLNDAIPKTYNSITGKEYTIDERIKKVGQIDKILDIAFTGELYKWDLSKCNVRMPNGQHRQMKIRADYVLKIPSPDNDKESLYIFAYQQNQVNKKDEAIKLSVISAFADCVDLTQGQEKPFTILKEEKQNIISKKKQTLFVHPAYQKEKNELAAAQTAQSALSNPSGTSKVTKMSISEDNNISTNITMQGGVAAISLNQPPNDLFTQLANDLVKGLDNIVHRASTAIEKINQAVTKAVLSITAPKSHSEARRASQSKNKGNSPKKKQVAKKAVSVAPVKRSEQKQEQRSSVLGDIKNIRAEQAQDKPEHAHQRTKTKSNNMEI